MHIEALLMVLFPGEAKEVHTKVFLIRIHPANSCPVRCTCCTQAHACTAPGFPKNYKYVKPEVPQDYRLTWAGALGDILAHALPPAGLHHEIPGQRRRRAQCERPSRLAVSPLCVFFLRVCLRLSAPFSQARLGYLQTCRGGQAIRNS